jgi:hypothetical protein
MASSWARSLVSRASVATTAMVVFVGPGDSPAPGQEGGTGSSPSPGRAPAIGVPSSSTISPKAFTAARAATVTPSSATDAVPMPPFTARSGPYSLATVAPVPAPTVPSATSSEAASQAA